MAVKPTADIVVIGAGVNGLVAGAWLARHKHATIIVDQSAEPGGAAATGEFAPGFFAPTYSHAIGPIRRDIAHALHLDRAGLELITPDPSLTVVGRANRTIVFHRDPVLTAQSIHRLSAADAGRWREFLQTTQQIAGVMATIAEQAPPAIDGKVSREWWPLLGAGRRARALGGRRLATLTRWLPMAVGDVATECFETDVLQAAIAARAIFGNYAGPRSAGTGGMLIQRLAEDPLPAGGGVTVRGGPGALAKALVAVATKAGADVRSGVRVTRIGVERGRATTVVLDSGEEISARAIVAAIDPRQVFASLVDAGDVPPTFRERVGHIRGRGVMAKINLALASAPTFTAVDGDPLPLRGRLLLADDLDYLERAFDAVKYGAISPAPWLEVAVPTLADPGLAPDGQHVMSIYAHFAPCRLREGDWTPGARDALYRAVLSVLERHAPGIGSLVLARDVITPEDLERRLGAVGGHIFHGEPTLDQTWMARPLLGWSQYITPIERLFLASAGTHPGGGLTGASGVLAAKAVMKALSARARS